MKQQIIDSISDPEKLESLYRQNQQDFGKFFSEISGDYDSSLVSFWKIRLSRDRSPARTKAQLRDLIEVLGIAVFTAVLALIPAVFTAIDQEFFFVRNVALIAFNGLILYSFWLNKDSGLKKLMAYGFILMASALYLNLLPASPGDSVLIAFLHVPLMLWCFFGLTYIRFDFRSLPNRMNFIRFSGELIIMAGLILLAGGVLTGITLGLFSVIGMEIEKIYTDFIAVPGALAAPVIAFYLIRTYPGITSKIAPVIARVFTPVVLATLTIYLVSLPFSKSSILENRELLIIFNLMLLGVLALIIFSISEISKAISEKNNLMGLFLLSVMAIVINSIAIIAIFSRLSDGLTPNRTVVLVTNLLVFVNLILITIKLFQARFKGAPAETIEKSVAGYLNVYAIWTVVAVFILPLVFGFR